MLTSRNKGRAFSIFRLKVLCASLLSLILLLQVTVFFAMPIFAEKTGSDCLAKFNKNGILYRTNSRLSKAASLPTQISAQSAVLLRADTGEILYKHNADAVRPMASTTKIMTALVALELLSPETPVKIPPEAVGIEGSSIYLTEGEILTLEELLYALMLSSANDAAVAIAVACSGSVDTFAERMNQKAKDLGLANTHFTNPHGLDDPNHHTTAYELGLIAREALSHDSLKAIISTKRKTIPHNGDDGVRLLLNHNKLLASYDGAVGVKTGFTKKSGRCLVSAASREGITLIAVTLNAPDDWHDHTALLDYGFSLYEQITLCTDGELEIPLPVVGGDDVYVMIKNRETLTMTLPKKRGSVISVVELPRFVYAPVGDQQHMGDLVFYEALPDGTWAELGRIPLITQYSVDAPEYKKSLLEKLADFFGF